MKNSNLQSVGRHGRLTLVVGVEGGKTVLRDSSSTIPMHAFPPFYPDDTGCAHLYMVNPTSGLVGGDRVEAEITLEEGAHAFITSPAATKVYKSAGAVSESRVHIRVGKNAVLEYLPRYVIPFAGSRYDQKTRVVMESGSMLFFFEAFTTGRTARREHLGFKEFRSLTEIVYCDDPVVTDRFVLEPGRSDYGALGLLESHAVSAVLYIIFDKPEPKKTLISGIEAVLREEGGVYGGVSELPLCGVGARLLGNSIHTVEKTAFRIFSLSRKTLLAMDSVVTWGRLMQ